ncbi:MAG: hypothetical protein HYX74_01680 [Acidobacteria bacterium]|nr:hypothetical protein [Acidobacteriota bacterium]
MKKHYLRSIVGLLSLLLLLVPGTVLAQRDPLAGLKRALAAAGAPALTSAQQEQLTALIQAFRDAHKPQAPDTAVGGAHTAYQNAILNRDAAGAQAQADIIADQMAAQARTRLKDAAKFQIDVLNVLSSDQVSAVQRRVGSAGLSRLLASLAGPRGGFQARVPGPGGMGPRGMRPGPR